MLKTQNLSFLNIHFLPKHCKIMINKSYYIYLRGKKYFFVCNIIFFCHQLYSIWKAIKVIRLFKRCRKFHFNQFSFFWNHSYSSFSRTEWSFIDYFLIGCIQQKNLVPVFFYFFFMKVVALIHISICNSLNIVLVCLTSSTPLRKENV